MADNLPELESSTDAPARQADDPAQGPRGAGSASARRGEGSPGRLRREQLRMGRPLPTANSLLRRPWSRHGHGASCPISKVRASPAPSRLYLTEPNVSVTGSPWRTLSKFPSTHARASSGIEPS